MNDYSDILRLDHPRSRGHRQMPLYERAAQFAPFAALSGFDAQICEESRHVERRPSLSAEDAAALNDTLHILIETEKRLRVRLTLFTPDACKEGGVTAETEGEVRRVDPVARRLIFSDRREVALDDIFSLDIL